MIAPTPKQVEIRDHPGLGLLVVAPAGCGKTEALALRIQGLIARGDVVAPRRILVTTFSNRARDGIRERLSAYLTPNVIRDRLSIANFHGVAARLFRAHARTIGLDPEMVMPEGNWVLEQCREGNLSFQESSAVQRILQQTKLEKLSDSEVMERLTQLGNRKAIEYEKRRLSENRLTYDDLLRSAELILANDEVAELYRQHFGAVVVDEFQDLTPQQLRVVNRIGFGRTTFAGDLAQGIYGFTGAKPAEVDAAIRSETSTEIRFAESHRSSPVVLTMVNSLDELTGGDELSCADPDSWPSGGLAGAVGFMTAEQEGRWAAATAVAILSRAPRQRVGIIARTGPRRRFADSAVAQYNDYQSFRWDDGVMDTDTARLLKAMLKTIDSTRVLEADNPIEYLREAITFDAIPEPRTRESVHDALGWTLDLLNDGETPAAIRMRIVIGDTGTLLTAPGIHLLTGHVGKGQQFDWVIVVGADEGTVPDFRAESQAELLEEARVLSVMISRARHGVIVTNALAVPAANGRVFNRDPSRFLRYLQVANPLDAPAIVRWIDDADWAAISNR